jgi:hypothetical protein
VVGTDIPSNAGLFLRDRPAYPFEEAGKYGRAVSDMPVSSAGTVRSNVCFHCRYRQFERRSLLQGPSVPMVVSLERPAIQGARMLLE